MSIETMERYCSHCFGLTSHCLDTRNTFRRNVYKCKGCDQKTVECRVCKNMARTSDSWDSEFCAEHDGTIAKFSSLTLQIDCISDFPKLFHRDVTNYRRVAKLTGATFLGAAVVAPLAFIAAPAVGGAIGASWLGLSGAAATNGGLALLGGGSIAAGGAGMAGGVAVVTAAGVALGGTLGGVTSNAYFSDIESFDIKKVRDGCEPAIVLIDGFLNQGVGTPDDWIGAIEALYPDNACFYVSWESKRLSQIGSMIGDQLTKGAVLKVASSWAAAASKKAAGSLGPVAWAASAAGLASNPWSVAMVKAEQTGVLLADIISRTNSRYVLCGHSLGARVIHYALMSLATRAESPMIESAHLLGGAVGSDAPDWQKARAAVSGTIFNYHSSNDRVLQVLYSAGTMFTSNPIGRSPVLNVGGVRNIDVSNLVDGHSMYKRPFASFGIVERPAASPLPKSTVSRRVVVAAIGIGVAVAAAAVAAYLL